MIVTKEQIKIEAQKYAASKNAGWNEELQTITADKEGFEAGADYVLQQLSHKYDVSGRSEQLPPPEDAIWYDVEGYKRCKYCAQLF